MVRKIVKKYKSLSLQAKASLWFLLCSVLQKGIATITTPIFTRIMSASEYGHFNVFVSWQGIVTSFIILTLPWGVVEQGLIKYSDVRQKFNSATLGLMTTLALIWFGIYWAFRDFWNAILSLTTQQMICLFLIIWSTSVFTFWSINQRIDYKYKKLTTLTLIIAVLNPIIGFLLVVNSDDKVTARIIGLAVVETVVYSVLYFQMMSRGRVYYSKTIWLYAIKFNIPLIPHYLSQRILNNSDRIMIQSMVGASEAGIYSLAYSLSLLMTIVNQAIQGALNPWIYNKLKEKKGYELKKVVYPTLLIVALMNLLLIAFAPEVLIVFAPPAYFDAIWIVPPVAMSVFFMFLYGFFANIEFYYEKTRQMSIATMVGAVINVILNFYFIRLYGYYAAGYTTLTCYVLYAISHYCFMKNICNKEMDGMVIFDKRTIVFISVLFVGIGFLISLTYYNSILRYIVIVIIAMIIIKKRNMIKNIMNLRKQSQ